MKKILLSLFFAVFALTVNAQFKGNYTMHCVVSCYRTNKGYGWSDWSKWEDCDMAICYYQTSNRFVIYSNETQFFNVLNCESKYDNEGNKYFDFKCVNASTGSRCNLDFRRIKDGVYELYVRYNDLEMGYGIKD